MSDILTLGEALPLEINRVQELLDLYKSLDMPECAISISMMEVELTAATLAMQRGDLREMIYYYERLKSYEE